MSENMLSLTSSTFRDGEDVPTVYTCDGDNTNPPLEISGVDEDAQSLALIMDDPDAPGGTFDHWVVFNIPPTTVKIEEGIEPEGVIGVGTSGERGYFGLCPPGERHRYVFTIYALDAMLDLNDGATKEEVLKAAEGHILQKATLLGYYER